MKKYGHRTPCEFAKNVVIQLKNVAMPGAIAKGKEYCLEHDVKFTEGRTMPPANVSAGATKILW